MTEHCDHVRHVFDGKRKGIPTVSIVGSLSDDYEGGYLRFWDKEDYFLGKGEVIFFPSNFLYPHRVTEITRGVRYTFVSWVW
jgi:predicted 2-oxoglutarate/Fe(II)-dependent dioxygenase YbiX